MRAPRGRHGATVGGKRTPEFNAWRKMRERCENPNFNQYKDYGGRGIWVCARWTSSFVAFRDDMGPKPDLSLQLDRVDNAIGYCCGQCDDCRSRGITKPNCAWVTRKQNMAHRRPPTPGCKTCGTHDHQGRHCPRRLAAVSSGSDVSHESPQRTDPGQRGFSTAGAR